MLKKEILEKTAKEYFADANEAFLKGSHNSAVVLYFKALVAFTDLYILVMTGKTPSSHTNRFKILKEKFSELYDLIDKDFPFYQSSYFQLMTKELAEVIRNDAKIVARKSGIEV